MTSKCVQNYTHYLCLLLLTCLSRKMTSSLNTGPTHYIKVNDQFTSVLPPKYLPNLLFISIPLFHHLTLSHTLRSVAFLQLPPIWVYKVSLHLPVSMLIFFPIFQRIILPKCTPDHVSLFNTCQLFQLSLG